MVFFQLKMGRTPSLILSNSSMHTVPRSASTMAPASRRRSPVSLSDTAIARTGGEKPCQSWGIGEGVVNVNRGRGERRRTDGGGETHTRRPSARRADGQDGGVHHSPDPVQEVQRTAKFVSCWKDVDALWRQVGHAVRGEHYLSSCDLAVEGSPTMSTLMSPLRCVLFSVIFSQPAHKSQDMKSQRGEL